MIDTFTMMSIAEQNGVCFNSLFNYDEVRRYSSHRGESITYEYREEVSNTYSNKREHPKATSERMLTFTSKIVDGVVVSI